MAESDFTPPIEPELRQTKYEPRGVLKKNLKMFVYLGAALLVIAAAIFSSSGKKTPSQQAAGKGQPPQPMLQDNTDNNVQDLKNQLQAERQKEQQQTATAIETGPAPLTPAQQAAAAAYGPTGVAAPCVAGQPCPQQSNGQPQLTPEQQQMEQLAAKERERADESRFASNLVYARSPDQPQQQNQVQQQASGQTASVSQPRCA
jgi:type IV secretion system protein VirB10